MSVERLPAGPFVAWLREQCDAHGREEVRRRLNLSGDQLAAFLARGPGDTVRLSSVDSALTRWDGPESLATLYPDDGYSDEPLRGGWTRPDLSAKAKLTDVHLRALHRAYMEQGVSINVLAKQVYERVGYRSHHSAAEAMSRGWSRLGLPRRDRIDAVRLACTTHGHGARDRDEREYREFMRKQRGWRAQQGPGQERCAAIKSQAPRKGERCARPSLVGSDFCIAHDPARRAEVEAAIAKGRARLERPDMLPMGPFSEWLEELRLEHGSMRAVAAITGLHYSAACRYVKGLDTAGRPKPMVSRRLVERARASVEAFDQARAQVAA